MVKYVKTNEKFINPYHFIRLMDSCSKNKSIKSLMETSNLISGWIKCELETISPIFIPNTTNEDVFKLTDPMGEPIKSYDFYSYKNLSDVVNPNPPIEPIIPGSEIRGAIRSAFEAVTNSCLSTLDSNIKLYKRVTHIGFPGRIIKENGDWHIQPCTKWSINPQKVVCEGNIPHNLNLLKEKQKVYLKNFENKLYITDQIDETQKSEYIQGYVHFGEHFGEKDRRMHLSAFIEKENISSIPIDDKTLTLLKENIELYQNPKINLLHIDHPKGVHRGYSRIRTNMDDLEGTLIYYQNHNNKYYLNPGQIGREVFFNTVLDIVKSYSACISENKLCSACQLFGFISTELKNQALASRIRFTDATFVKSEEDTLFLKEGIIPELSSPKLSATEFYLKKPLDENGKKVDLWNYDYAGYWEEIEEDNKKRWEWKPFTKYPIQIRGRKFYWHHRFSPKSYIPDNSEERSQRNKKIRPLNEHAFFTFKIFFNNITETELKQLIWILNFGGDKTKAHKIGMGKPLGLGSILINIKKLKVRELIFNGTDLSYAIKPRMEFVSEVHSLDKPWELLECSEEVFKEFLVISDWKKGFDFDYSVIYPENVDEKETFRWFIANRQIYVTGMRPKIHQTLPEDISEPFLFKYKKLQKKK